MPGAGIECPKCGMQMMQSQADHQVRCLHDGCGLPGPAKRGQEYRDATEKQREHMTGIVIKKRLAA